MSAQFTWDDPFRTGFAGSYDPGTMYGLIFRAQAGDLAAKNHLAQAGFFDAQGNDVWGAYNQNPNAPGTSNHFGAVDAWAKARGLQQYSGPNPFRWNSTWGSATAPGFQQAWDTQWGNARLGAPPGTPGAGAQQPSGNNIIPQTTPQGGNGGAGQGGNAWVNNIPEWTNGGGYRFGWDYSPQRGWTPKAGIQRAGSIIGAEVGWNTPMYVPVDYNASADTARFEFGGNPQGENAVERAIRKTADAVRGNPRLNAQHVFEYLLANFARDAAAQGKSIGMDMSKFSQVAYGEAYDPNKVYMAQGVVNPWTGRPAGNASGGGVAGPGQQGQQQTTPPGTTPPATGTAQTTTPPPTQGLPTGYQGQNPGTSGGLTAAQRLALSDDPNQAYRYMMQQLGYNPSAPGLLGNFLKRRFQPLLEARMAASGVTDNSNYMDTIDQIINEFGGGLFQKGGNFFGNLRDVGTQAAGQAAPFLNSLQDQNQAMQYMNQLGMLRYAGGNPLVQQAMADEMQRGREAYQDEAFNRELSGQQLDPFTQWLMGTRYRNYFGL